MYINGKKVVDLTEPLTININKQDALKASRRDPGNCAAARAIIRQFKTKGATGARVHIGRTYIEYPDRWVRCVTPQSLKLEIVSFDRKAKAEYAVGEYTLGPIPKTKRLGVDQSKAHGKSKKPHIVRHVHQIEGIRARGANR